MNSFFLIDKPLGLTSFDVIRQLRKTFNIKKMGHTGTLDPLATGCLLVATENYTKLIPFFEKDTKEYEFTLCFDGVTESFDLGKEVQFCDKNLFETTKAALGKEKIQKLLEKYFLGEIEQVPPKYSALKIGGKKAVDLVREGKEVKMQKRSVTIFEIEILDFSFPELTLRAKVSAGTYIRSIAADLGQIIGTGAYVTKLCRTKIGNLSISQSFTLDTLIDKDHLAITDVFPQNKFLDISDEIRNKINHGMRVKFSGIEKGYYFLGNPKEITNVIFFDGSVLHPKKKIL